jgi:hypothetical protein
MTSPSSELLVYVPYHLLGDKPNIIVDGSGNENTRLTLSHWPGNDTPSQFKADLSAEIVFNFLDRGEIPADVNAVSNNHFDEDGLVSMYSLINPDDAQEMRDFLIEVARAGDFGKCDDRDAARVSFVINAWTDPERSPLNRTMFSGTHSQLDATLYEELLVRLPNIIYRLGSFEEFWKADDAFMDLTEDAIDKGLIEIEEDEEHDLAIITIPDGGIHGQGRPPSHSKSWISTVCHPMVIHNRINSHRVLVIQQRRYQFYYRYESWVDYRSKPILPRVDLDYLCMRLNELERGSNHWKFSGIDDIIGRLSMNERSDSRLSPLQFVDLLKTALRSPDAAGKGVRRA